MSDEKKLVSHYTLKTLLRKDGFGAVYLGEDTRDGREYALRIIELDGPTLARITGRVRARSQRDHPLIEQIRQRMKRISELKHSHILPVIEFGEEHIQGNNDIIFYMVSPYERESLLSYWSSRTSSDEFISLEIIADLIFQAGEALYYVHKRGLTHQYVRLSSFMLRSSARGRRHLHLLLTDFWFADITSAILEEGQISQDLSLYLAPEQLSGRVLAASDQYTLALLAYELLLGHRLSQVDLSLGLYEHALRQRSAQLSASELELAHRLDLVLARALAEDATTRFTNIEEFVYTFRAVARGEAVDLADEETFKLPVVGEKRGRGQDAAIVAGAVGALAAGEIGEEVAEARTTGDSTAEMLSAAQIDEQAHPEHRHGLHKTVLTSEGMEAVELAATGELLEETTLPAQAATGAQGAAIVEEEQTLAVVEEEQTQPSAGAAGLAGFAAGLAAGATMQREADIAEERTQLIESSEAAFAAGEAAQREIDIAEERTLVRESSEAAFAAGLAAGEVIQQERDIAEERTQSEAAFVAGLAAGEAVVLEQEADIAEEQTQIIGGETLAAGGAGLLAGGLLAGELGATSAAGEFVGMGGELASTGAAGGIVGTGGEIGAVGAAGAGAAAGGFAGAGGFGTGGEVTQFAGAGAAGAGMAGMGAGVLESTQVAGAGGGVAATGGVAAAGGAAGGRRRRRRRTLLVAIIIVLLLALIGSGLFVFAGSQATATVTLTLQSRTIQSTYLVTAVTTTTSQGQVQATTLTQTVSQSKTGHASGYFPGVEASGFISFSNTSTGCGCPVFIPAGTPFTSSTGVTVVIDYGISVASQCTVTVPAHAMIYGPAGDIPAGSIHAAFGAHVTGTNRFAFTGGQSGQSNALVQQSDINSLASALQSQNEQNAQAGLESQLTSGQRLAGTPRCQSKTSADHPAGSFATSVTVTVKTTCTAEAYDFAGVVQIVQQEVQTQATSYFSSDFVEVGTLQTTVTNATVTDAKTGTLLLAVQAVGKWAYHLSQSFKQSLAKLIAGLDVNRARALLSSETGIAAVNIAISGPNQNTLPSDDSKITIVLRD
jgi:hypothetical protein